MGKAIDLDYFEKLALVYVRQSTPGQVKNNVESRRRQEGLTSLAIELGWDSTKVFVIKDDLGKSGSNSLERHGYQKLQKLLLEGKVGIILALEMSRLSRDDIDWKILIRQSMFEGVLLADDQRIYDPRDPHDQVLLGILGTLAEYELSLLHRRMYEAWKQKASRGELYCASPIGYVIEGPSVIKDPNQRIGHVLESIFEHFPACGSVGELCRWCCSEGLQLPAYVTGKGYGELVWNEAATSRLVQILQNPCYSGTYVLGRRKTQKELGENGQVIRRQVKVPMSEWPIVIKDHHEPYISWDQFMTNYEKIESNSPLPATGINRAVQRGESLVAGLLRCGRCGYKLQVGYSKKGAVRYLCRNGSKQRSGRGTGCFSFQGQRLDHLAAELVFEIVRPAGVKAAHRASEELHQQWEQRRRNLTDHVSQLGYEANRAFRQYNNVDPENRLVASELERRWEDRLQKLRVEESKLAAFDSENPKLPTPSQQEELLELGSHLERIWFDEKISITLKKQIVRLLIQEIIVDIEEESDEVHVCVHWVDDCHSNHCLPRHSRSKGPDTIDLASVVCHLRLVASDQQIARILNRAGIKTSTHVFWTEKRISTFRKRHGISAYSEEEKSRRGILLMEEAATRLQISPMSTHRLIKEGIIPAKQTANGLPWVIYQSDLDKEAVKRAVQSIKSGQNAPLPENSKQLTLWK